MRIGTREKLWENFCVLSVHRCTVLIQIESEKDGECQRDSGASVTALICYTAATFLTRTDEARAEPDTNQRSKETLIISLEV